MKNYLKISTTGEDILSCTDDGTNRLFINGSEIASSYWIGTGTYQQTVNGHLVTITKVPENVGNIALRETGSYTYELYSIQAPTINVLDMVYPVGSIYMSVNNVDPSTVIGGTWEQIKDTFLLSAGDTYVGGATGGEATHKLTTNEMPSHNHSITTSQVGSGGDGWYTAHIHANNNGTTYTNNTGSGQAHNNMPPYLVVYMWKRTA